MKFDIIIVGGGLAGLTCGIKLQSRGKKCLIISTGQSTLNFSSGSFDLLSYNDDDTIVTEINTAVEELIKQKPQHPYAKIGLDRFFEYAQSMRRLLSEAGVMTQGEQHRNHYRMSPMGTVIPTWISAADFLTFAEPDKSEYNKVLLIDIDGLTDYNANMVMLGLSDLNVSSQIWAIDLPSLGTISKNPSELRSTNISLILNKIESWDSLIAELSHKASGFDAVILPAVVNNFDTLGQLSEKIKKPIKLVATMPPSSMGQSVESKLKQQYRKLGGYFMQGDTMVAPYMVDGEVKGVYTRNHGDMPFESDNVVLATGRFFSNGLVSNQNEIAEPIFGLDVAMPENRESWYDRNFFGDHHYMESGVRCNSMFQPSIAGRLVKNLYICGSIVEGANSAKEGSGAGVAMTTALRVADIIA